MEIEKVFLKSKFSDLEQIIAGNSFSFIKFIYGMILFFISIRYLIYGWIERYYILPKFHFRYPYFDWIPLIPLDLIYYVFVVLSFSSLLFSLGIFYKISLFIAWISFSWIFFQDVSYYLNHYYLLIVVGIYFLVLPEPNHNFLSKRNYYPKIGILSFRIQLSVVYFCAGIAKINPDWLLEGLPLKIWLNRNTFIPVEILTIKQQALFFSWIGMLFDLTIPFWMWIKRTRNYAYLVIILFHIFTRLLFEIGVFPWVMIFFTTIFFESDWILKIKNKLLRKEIELYDNNFKILNINIYKKIILFFLIMFQVLFPFRFLLDLPDYTIKSYINEVLWKENNFRWSWRVMLVQKSGFILFYIYDENQNLLEIHNPKEILSHIQYDMMSYQSDLICQYAEYIRQKKELEYKEKIYIKAENYVSWNGKTAKFYIDPEQKINKLNCIVKDFF